MSIRFVNIRWIWRHVDRIQLRSSQKFAKKDKELCSKESQLDSTKFKSDFTKVIIAAKVSRLNAVNAVNLFPLCSLIEAI